MVNTNCSNLNYRTNRITIRSIFVSYLLEGYIRVHLNYLLGNSIKKKNKQKSVIELILLEIVHVFDLLINISHIHLIFAYS